MMKRKNLFLISLLLFLVACGEPEPIRIGFVGTLSGRHSEIGVAARNAAILKIDEINEAGGIKGRPIQLVVRDSLGDPAKCQEILESMMDEGFTFILGPLFSQMAEVTLNVIEGRDVLVMTPTMSTDYLTGRDDNLIRTCSTTSMQAEQLAKRAHDMGLKKVAVVYDLSNRRYTELLYESYREHAEALGMDISKVLTLDKANTKGMLPVAERLLSVDSDGVLMCLSAIDAANLSQQIRKLGSDTQFFGVSWSQTEDLIIQGGKAVEGMQLIAFKSYGNPSPAQTAFDKLYYDRYKQTASFVSGRCYEAVGVLSRGMAESESLDAKSVKETILGIGEFQGLNTTLNIDRFGDSVTGYFGVTVKDGKYISSD